MAPVKSGVVEHRLFTDARDDFVPMCCDAADGLVLLLVGPTQSGKSLIFSEVVSALKNCFRDERKGSIPVSELQIETVSEGRAKTKWLGLELLKVLKHPIYEHIGCFDEDAHYFPSKGRDEGTIRIALKEAFTNRFSRRVCLDEVHLLTRTKDPDLRGAILESVKSTCAINRTLIACGGYEIAYKGLFDSPHFSGRLLVYDMGYYDANNPVDLHDWKRLSKTCSKGLNLEPRTLLVDQAYFTLVRTNGVFGLFKKWIWQCSVIAKARNIPIDSKLLHSLAPSAAEHRAIANDIKLGRKALEKLPVVPKKKEEKKEETGTDGKATSADKSESKKPERLPFERNPNRNAAMAIDLHDDD